MRRIVIRVGLAAIVAGGLCGGVAYAGGAIPGADGVIHGCYDAGGRLRVIDLARATCRRGEAPIQWNERGARGNPGRAGQTPDIVSLRTAVVSLQTQVTTLQAQVTTLQTQVAGAKTQPVAPQPPSTATPAVPLQSITIAPAVPTLLGSTTQLTATGQYSDGTTKDLTTSVTWNLTPGSGAALGASGLFSCPGGGVGGFFTVTATLGGVTGSAQEDCPAG